MIKINKLTKKFGSQLIIDKIDLDIEKGETLAVIGPSGCGKSTLLRLIIKLISPDSGSINVDGLEITKLNNQSISQLRQKVSMVFQSSALFDSLTVGENVAFALKEKGLLPDYEIKRIVKEKLKLVDLEGTENLMPAELSGGMQKRVSFARAIAFNPQILLYDEPTTGLDPITSTAIENLISKLSRELKTTSIVVTHQLSTIFRTASRIVMMHDHKLIDVGSPEQAQKSTNPIVHRFLTAGLEN